MTVRYTMHNGKKTKLYPAFNTEAHQHDIAFRRVRLQNEIYASYFPETDVEGRYPKLTDAEIDKAEKLVDQLTEILEYTSFPVTYLPWDLYQIARETIMWAGCARG